MSGFSGAQGVIVLGQSSAAVPTTGDTAEHTLATTTIPAGALGANGRVEIKFDATWPSSANTKTVRVRLGATSLLAVGSTTTTGTQVQGAIVNRNSASVQRGIGTHITSTGNSNAIAPSVGAIDTTANVDITITGQLALGTETITLESYQVLLYPKG